VPDWLGKTAVLLQLKCCVVCKRQWKKSESGAARWVGLSSQSIVYDPSSAATDRSGRS
jgi:hypothetical protein